MASKGKVATIIVIDVGSRMSVRSCTEKKTTYLERAVSCATRILLRQIFSGDNDEVGIITFGSDETINTLADDGNYRNISVLADLCTSSWDLVDKVRALRSSGVENSNWAQALIVAIDSLKTFNESRKFRDKQIVFISNFTGQIEFSHENLDTLVKVIEDYEVKLVLVGLEGKRSSGAVNDLVSRLETATSLSFDEADREFKYYRGVRKSPRLLSVVFEIGLDIKIPVYWIKFNRDRLKVTAAWQEVDSIGEEFNQTIQVPDKTEKRPVTKYAMTTDDVKTAYYGVTPVALNYADLEALKKKPVLATFSLIGCTKKANLNPFMYVGSDLYVVRPKHNDKRSVAMLSAFVNALIGSDRVGIAKRILMKNGKLNIGALLPVVDYSGVYMYFLKLPLAEWVRHVPPAGKKLPTDDEERASAVDDFIDSKLLPSDLLENDSGLLLPNPSFQNHCHLLARSALTDELVDEPEDSEFGQDTPDFVLKILNPVDQIKEDDSEAALDRINRLFPLKPRRQSFPKSKRANKNNMDNDYELDDDNKSPDTLADSLVAGIDWNALSDSDFDNK